jgi:hypothetical protein
MDRKLFNEQVTALADLSEAVGRFAAVFGEVWATDKRTLREMVLRVSRVLFDPLLTAPEPEAAPAKAEAKKGKGGRPRKTETVRAAFKAARAEKKAAVDAKLAAAGKKLQAKLAAKETAAGASAGGTGPTAGTVCPDCGDTFEKTGRNQKRCAVCAAVRQAGQKAQWSARQKNPGATAERLARIKEVDKRLDTIPEAGATGGGAA